MNAPLETKLCSADEAVSFIQDGQTVASGGFVGAGHPESLTSALENRFIQTQTPRNLTLVYAAGQGDGHNRGVNHLAHKGLLKRVIGGHWGLAPKLGKLAIEGSIEAYNFPQGVMCQLFRDIAAGRPGCITHIGLNTFIDPDLMGGRLDERTPVGLVEKIELDGKKWLWYKSFPIDVGLIRATAADPFGNLVMHKEAFFGDMLAIAQAARNSGGRVIAQVESLLKEPANPQTVKVPGILVDHIVVAEPHEHEQTYAEHYNPGYCAAAPTETRKAGYYERLPFSERRIICNRACDELPKGAIVNLGIGMPEGIARIAAERGLTDQFTLTVESGPIGGVPAGGLSFGASLYPQAVIDQPAQFDYYDGGGLDFAALGAAQIGSSGDVNVSKFGSKLAGVGGFVNITQTAKKLVFCGSFTAKGLQIEIKNQTLNIVREGSERKFVNSVEQISFSAKQARQAGQTVLYITERAVFKLVADGIELTEVMPGIDIHTQILDLMEFKPIMREVKIMPEHVLQ